MEASEHLEEAYAWGLLVQDIPADAHWAKHVFFCWLHIQSQLGPTLTTPGRLVLQILLHANDVVNTWANWHPFGVRELPQEVHKLLGQ